MTWYLIIDRRNHDKGRLTLNPHPLSQAQQTVPRLWPIQCRGSAVQLICEGGYGTMRRRHCMNEGRAKKIWYLDTVINGVRHQRRLGKGITRSVAKELAQVIRGQILKGDFGIGKKTKDLTFDEARKKFEAWATARKETRTPSEVLQGMSASPRRVVQRQASEPDFFLRASRSTGKTRIATGARVRANRELAVFKACSTSAWS